MDSKPTRPVPTARQIEYQDWEFGIFIHFGIRTFYEGLSDWDGGDMDPLRFNPTRLDCTQWTETAAAAGARYMVLTAKYHDGFTNWPSQTTHFGVQGSDWKRGRGDLVREFTEACRKSGLGIGLCYSPADAHCPFFRDREVYDEYMLDQISELLGNYGPIDMLWLNESRSEGRGYDWPGILGEAQRQQPGLLVFNMANPGCRRTGDESGLAPVPCRSTPETANLWLPAECICRMRDSSWFHSDENEHTVKSVEELMGLYYYSVGRGCNLLLNVGPEPGGLLPELDRTRLLEFGVERERRFGSPIAGLADFTEESGSWRFTPDTPILIDHVVLQEAIENGKTVQRFAVHVLPDQGVEPVTVYEGRDIGHKAICRFPPIRASAVQIEAVGLNGPTRFRDIRIFCAAVQ